MQRFVSKKTSLIQNELLNYHKFSTKLTKLIIPIPGITRLPLGVVGRTGVPLWVVG
jgi:hypothetical protein